MWTIKFEPYKENETVGSIIATYDEGLVSEFVFSGTINLDDAIGQTEFVAKAKATLVETNKLVPTVVSTVLTSITTSLNK